MIGARGDFRKLLGATSISHFGTMMGALGLTALVYLDVTAGQMGLLAALSGVPSLVFALAAGVWVDRLPRRRVMVIADFGRAGLLLSVPAAALLGELHMGQLYAVAFLSGLLEVFFNVAYRSLLPALVPTSQLVEANGRLQMSESVAESVSPAVGGGIVHAFGGPAAVLVDALSFAVSGLFVASIRRSEVPAPQARASVLREAQEGVAVIARSPLLRAFAGVEATMSLFGGFFFALYGLWIIDGLGFSALTVGIMTGAGGLGSFGGAALASRLSQRFGVGGTVTAARLLSGIAGLGVPLAGGPDWLALALLFTHQFAGDALWVVHDINALSLRQSLTPAHQLGRVNAGFLLLGNGLLPAGALLAGAIATAAGLRAAMLVGALGQLAAVLWLVWSPVPRIRVTSDT